MISIFLSNYVFHWNIYFNKKWSSPKHKLTWKNNSMNEDSPIMTPDIWLPIYDSRSLNLDLWLLIYDSWSMIPDLWLKIFDSPSYNLDLRLPIYGSRSMIPDLWLPIYISWSMTLDLWFPIYDSRKFVLFSCGHQDCMVRHPLHNLHCKHRKRTSPNYNKCYVSLLIVFWYEEEWKLRKKRKFTTKMWDKKKKHRTDRTQVLWRDV